MVENMLLIHLNNDLVSQYKLFLDTTASQDWDYESKRVAKIDLVIVPSVTIVKCYHIN